MDPEGQPNFNPNVVVGTSANGYNGRASGIDVQQYRRQVIFGINLRF